MIIIYDKTTGKPQYTMDVDAIEFNLKDDQAIVETNDNIASIDDYTIKNGKPVKTSTLYERSLINQECRRRITEAYVGIEGDENEEVFVRLRSAQPSGSDTERDRLLAKAAELKAALTPDSTTDYTDDSIWAA